MKTGSMRIPGKRRKGVMLKCHAVTSGFVVVAVVDEHVYPRL